MEFKKQKDIDEYIKNQGLFKYNNELYMKTGVYDWINIDDRKDKIIEFIEKNINPFVDLTITIPAIDLSIFNKFEDRENVIDNHTIMLEEIKDGKKFLNRNWRLIKTTSGFKVNNNLFKYLIFNLQNKEYNALKESFISEKSIKTAYEVKNIGIIKRLKKDNLKNQYNTAYETELKQLGAIGVAEQ